MGRTYTREQRETKKQPVRPRCGATGKVSFESHEAAATRAGEIITASAVKELRTYLCKSCNGWHLTSQQ